MPVITPDFADRPKLAPGIYPARVIGCEMKQSKSGSPYLNWKFETETSNPANNRQWVYTGTALVGKGAQLLKKIICATLDPAYESGPIDTDQCIGCEVKIQVDRALNADGSESPFLMVLDVQPRRLVEQPGAFAEFEEQAGF